MFLFIALCMKGSPFAHLLREITSVKHVILRVKVGNVQKVYYWYYNNLKNILMIYIITAVSIIMVKETRIPEEYHYLL